METIAEVQTPQRRGLGLNNHYGDDQVLESSPLLSNFYAASPAGASFSTPPMPSDYAKLGSESKGTTLDASPLSTRDGQSDSSTVSTSNTPVPAPETIQIPGATQPNTNANSTKTLQYSLSKKAELRLASAKQKLTVSYH